MKTNIIWHISDIHIRKGVADDILYAITQLIGKIKANKSQQPIENQLIVIAGDVFENKDRLNQYDLECFHNIIELLNFIKVLIIPGNHDFSPNSDRNLDLITAALKNTHYNHVYMFRNSGVYNIPAFDNIEFHILSPIDKIIPTISEQHNVFRVAILHEPINKCQMYGSVEEISGRFSVSDFNNYNLVLAGDIHKQQFLSKNIAYCGSLIQKNKSEDISHGCLIWTIISNPVESKFTLLDPIKKYFKLNNAHIILKARDDTMLCPKEKMYNNIKSVELRHLNCTSDKVKEFMVIIDQKYNKLSKVTDLNEKNITMGSNQIKVTSSLEIQDQLQFLTDELKNSPYKDEILKKHIYLSDELSNELNHIKNKWKLNYLAWSNVFCYGENNYINFNSLSNINSLIGKNKTGKSSIINILIFILYNKLLYGDRKSIINQNCKYYKIICSFSTLSDSNNEQYIIFREGDNGLKNQHQKFRLLQSEITDPPNKNWHNITAATIPQTYNIIKSLIGVYHDLINVNISMQDNIFIVNKKSKDQVSEFSKYFELDRLEIIENLLKKKICEIKLNIRLLNKNLTEVEKTIEYKINDKLNLADIDLAIKTSQDIKNKLEESIIQKRLCRDNFYKQLYPSSDNLTEITEKLNQMDLIFKNDNRWINLDAQDIIKKKSTNEQSLEQLYKKYTDISMPIDLKKQLNDIKIKLSKFQLINETLDDLKIKLGSYISQLNEPVYTKFNIDHLELISNLTLDNLNDKLNAIIQKIEDLQKKIISIPASSDIKRTELSEIEVTRTIISESYQELCSQIIEIDKTFDPTIIIEDPKIQLNQLLKDKKTTETKIILLGEKLRITKYLKFNNSCECCINNQSNLIQNIDQKQLENQLLIISDNIRKYKEYDTYKNNLNTHLNNLEVNKKIDILHDKQYYKNIKLKEENELAKTLLKKLQTQESDIRLKIEILESRDIIISNAKINSQNFNLKESIKVLQNQITLLELKKDLDIKIKICKDNEDISNKIALLKDENKYYSQLLYNYEIKQNLLNKVKIINNNIKLNTDIDNINSIIINQEQKVASKIKALQKQYILRKDYIEYKKIEKSINIAENELNMYSQYLQCIDSNHGIPYKILKQSCANIEIGINNILNDITDFNISLGFEFKKFKIMIKHNNSLISAAQGSGFQKFIIDLAMRLCLACRHPNMPDFFIIDEGFGCLDNIHLGSTVEFLEKLNRQNKFDWMIVISHIENLHNITDQQIGIAIINGKSKVNIGYKPRIPNVDSLIYTQDDAESDDDNSVMNDPNNPNKLYCIVCKKSLKYSPDKRANHIIGEIHISNLIKKKQKDRYDKLYDAL